MLQALADLHWLQRSKWGVSDGEKPLWSMCVCTEEF